MGEHSMADGMPAVALCNHIKQLEYGGLKSRCYDTDSNSEGSSLSKQVPLIQNIFSDAISTMDSNDINTMQESLDKGT
jgi:hypothetical protein